VRHAPRTRDRTNPIFEMPIRLRKTVDPTSSPRLQRRIHRWIASLAAVFLAAAPFATAQPRPIVKDPEAAEPAIPKARVVGLPKTSGSVTKSSKNITPATAKPKATTKTKLGDEPWFTAAASFDPSAAIAVSLTAQIRSTAVTAESAKNLSVLILGDSLALCGFGQRLDSRFRKSPQFKSVYTYMTCGTVPLSWLRNGGYANAKTCCGYFTIESDDDGSGPIVVEDTYGNKRGTKPKAHPVPKIEDLLEHVKPDILVIQTGTNLFDLFTDGKSINPDRHDKALKSHIIPFMREVLKTHTSLRKIYWIGSPTSGRVSGEIQEFVFERCVRFTAPAATVIDSRTLVTYPFTGLQRDREHFGGADMNRWADRVFERVMGDLTFHALPPVITAQIPEEEKPPVANPGADDKALVVKARLTFKSPPLRPEQFAPYHEASVAFAYDVVKVIKGDYQEKQIVVIHPSHLNNQPQSLAKYKIGSTYELRLQDFDETPWATRKPSDQTGLGDLLRFMQTVDVRKLPARGQ
jgi:hypothetical protein